MGVLIQGLKCSWGHGCLDLKDFVCGLGKKGTGGFGLETHRGSPASGCGGRRGWASLALGNAHVLLIRPMHVTVRNIHTWVYMGKKTFTLTSTHRGTHSTSRYKQVHSYTLHDKHTGYASILHTQESPGPCAYPPTHAYGEQTGTYRHMHKDTQACLHSDAQAHT